MNSKLVMRQVIEERTRELLAEGCPRDRVEYLRGLALDGLHMAVAESNRSASLLHSIKEILGEMKGNLFLPAGAEKQHRALRKIEGYAQELPDTPEREQILTCVRKGLRIFK